MYKTKENKPKSHPPPPPPPFLPEKEKEKRRLNYIKNGKKAKQAKI
jgi:hypothetical protein